MALRWKKNKPPTGLARIGAAPSGHTLWDGDQRFAVVSALNHSPNSAWYWEAGWGSGVPHMNTCSEPVADADLAKTAAMTYVRQHIASQIDKTTPSGAG